MKLEGTVFLEMEEVAQAVADYVNRVHQIEVAADKVRFYPNTCGQWGIRATIDVPVNIERDVKAA